MDSCPYCNSENIYFSKKEQKYKCEDCERSFEREQEAPQALRIFFSYGHDANTPVVDALRTELEKRGHEVWIDTSAIKSGDDWRTDITQGVLGSDRVLAFLSQHSVRKPGVCLDELRIALCVKGAEIQTVLLEDENSVKPPASLTNVQWMDLSNWQNAYRGGQEQWQTWMQDQVASLVAIIESDNSLKYAGDINTLFSHLQPNLSSLKQEQLLKHDFVGRGWLTEQIYAWLERSESTQALMVTGNAGSGKSAYFAQLAHYDHRVVASIFFSWDNNLLNDIQLTVKTLAFKLATKLPDYREHLLRVLDEEYFNIDELSDNALFEILVAEPLMNCIDGGRENMIILFDSLDEAHDGNSSLIQFLATSLPKLPRWLKVICSSRPYASVCALFQDAERISLENPDSDKDIARYLSEELRPAFSIDDELLGLLTSQCEGSFLYAACLIAALKRHEISLEDRGAWPKGMAGFYHQMFLRAFPDIGHYRMIRPMLEVICAGRDISLELLRRMFDLDSYEILELREVLDGFLRIEKSKYPYTSDTLSFLRFTHQSIREWLTNSDQAGAYYIDAKQGATRLADYALREVSASPQCASKPKRYTSSSCPQINIDLVLDNLQQNLADYLLVAGYETEYVDFLLNKAPLDPYYWSSVRAIKNTLILQRLAEHLYAQGKNIYQVVSYGHPDHLPDLFKVFFTLSSAIASPSIAQAFYSTLLDKQLGEYDEYSFRLDGMFKSGFSDSYPHSGLHWFNADKIDIAFAVLKCLKACHQHDISVPETVLEECERLKIACFYYQGRYKGNEDDTDFYYMNFLGHFRDEICELGEEIARDQFGMTDVVSLKEMFNTNCLRYYMQYRDDLDDAYVQKLLLNGANWKHAYRDCERSLRESKIGHGRLQQLAEQKDRLSASCAYD